MSTPRPSRRFESPSDTAMPPRRRFALLAGALLALGLPSLASAQTPPTLQDFPLRDRLFGSGGFWSPSFVTPSDSTLTFITGTSGGPKGMVFGAAIVDSRCQNRQAPEIRVLAAPPGVKLSTRLASFRASAVDTGPSFCVGRTVTGTVLTYSGRPPRAGAMVRLRVIYPPMGAWYDHTVQIPAR